MNLSKSIFQDFLPIIISFVVGALVLLFVGENPLEIYSLMLSEGFGSTRRIAATLSSATPLIFTAVATAICFRSGVFNIGIEGAFVLGGLAGAFVGFSIEINNSFFHILLCLLAGILVGGFWLYLPSWLRANWKVDEVVTTLMLNFIAAAIASGLVNGAAGVGGPPFVTVLIARNDNAIITRANIILTLGCMSLFTLGTQIFYGMVTLDLIKISLYTFPIYVGFTWFGARYFNQSGAEYFKKGALIMLLSIALITIIINL